MNPEMIAAVFGWDPRIEVRVIRLAPQGLAGYVGRMPPCMPGQLVEEINRRWGGGQYRAQYYARGRIRSFVDLQIVGDPRGYLPAGTYDMRVAGVRLEGNSFTQTMEELKRKFQVQNRIRADNQERSAFIRKDTKKGTKKNAKGKKR